MPAATAVPSSRHVIRSRRSIRLQIRALRSWRGWISCSRRWPVDRLSHRATSDIGCASRSRNGPFLGVRATHPADEAGDWTLKPRQLANDRPCWRNKPQNRRDIHLSFTGTPKLCFDALRLTPAAFNDPPAMAPGSDLFRCRGLAFLKSIDRAFPHFGPQPRSEILRLTARIKWSVVDRCHTQ